MLWLIGIKLMEKGMWLGGLCHVSTGYPWDAHFHRQCGVQSGTLDHDTQHPPAWRGVGLQVGLTVEWWQRDVLAGYCDAWRKWHSGVDFEMTNNFITPSQHTRQLPVPQRNKGPCWEERLQASDLPRVHEQRRSLDAGMKHFSLDSSIICYVNIVMLTSTLRQGS